jgi:hypothetical protein
VEPESDGVPGGVVMTIQIDVICVCPDHYRGRAEGVEKWFNGEIEEKGSKRVSLGNAPGNSEDGAGMSIDGYGSESVMVCCVY